MSNTPMQTVSSIEAARMAKKLTKTQVCAEANICNSTYTYMINRGIAGHDLNQEHVDKIRQAIDKLPSNAPLQIRRKK